MADFTQAIGIVLADEGGTSCAANDHGGLTKFGISQRSYPDLDLATLTQDDAIAIYHSDFWHPLFDQLHSQALATKLLVMAVNMGTHGAVYLLQQALNHLGSTLATDGQFGQHTLEAANESDPYALLTELKVQGVLQYVSILLRDPTQATFIKGWIRRQLA